MSGKAIVLIGMPGSGKTTIAELLSAKCGSYYIDIDHIIEQMMGRPLPDILYDFGNYAFRATEEEACLRIPPGDYVIATGGSVVYLPRAMEHLRSLGTVFYLRISVGTVIHRLDDVETRAILKRPGQTLESLWAERDPLYRRFAHWIVSVGKKTPAELCSLILQLNREIPGDAEKEAEGQEAGTKGGE